jgi:DNA-binding transcriptional MocR family regulator
VQVSRLAELVAARQAPGGRTRSLASALRSLIVDGRLLSGDRLPAERTLAVSLGLSRSTVTAAYDYLRGEGYIIGRRGAGTFVGLPPAPAAGRPDEQGGVGDPSLLDFTMATLPAPAILADSAVRAAESLLVQLAGNGLEPAGLFELRSLIAADYTERGLATGPDQILITSGALHGWDLLLRTFASPGALVVTEQPTYPGVIDAALAHRVRLRPLPVDPDGWHPDDMELRRAPCLAHLTFFGQNPTGGWADRSTQKQVISSFTSSTVVAVDEVMIDYPHEDADCRLWRGGRAQPTVVILGSASKSLWAGLRTGWIRGPQTLIRRVSAVRSSQDLAPPVLGQLVVADLMKHRDDILPERRATVASRRTALLEALHRHCPNWTVTPPAGGLSTWIDLGGRSSTQLAIQARQVGVRITPGPRFTHDGTHDGWLRLPFVLPEEVLDEAVGRVASAAQNLGPARPLHHPTAATAWTA